MGDDPIEPAGEHVNFAIVDATAGQSEQAPLGHADSRYAIPIANVPLICHVFDELAQSGIDRARIIAAPGVCEDLGRIVGHGRPWDIEVSYLDTAADDGRHVVLSQLEQALDQGPVMLHPGDCLLRTQLRRMRERFGAGDVDSVIPGQLTVGSARDPADRRVSETCLVLGPGTRPLFDELLSPAGEADDLIATLLHSDCRLAVCEQTEHWCYSDSTEGLLTANRMMLDSIPAQPDETSFSDGNQIHGRVLIDPAAWVSNCVLHGPVAIDARAVIEDSFIGPYTAVGSDAIVSGAELDNSMILRGAEIRHPGFRIEGSIIGERCAILRSFELPRGLHLRLGSDSRVTFS